MSYILISRSGGGKCPCTITFLDSGSKHEKVCRTEKEEYDFMKQIIGNASAVLVIENNMGGAYTIKGWFPHARFFAETPEILGLRVTRELKTNAQILAHVKKVNCFYY